MLTEFRNEPLTDFTNAANERAMKASLIKVKSQLGRTYPLIIGRQKIESNDWLISTNPGAPKEQIGRFHRANKEHAEKALEEALNAFALWQHTNPHQRARYLLRAAALMRSRKHDLAAWMIYEIGKNWAEADADVAEAIDFCEFYAREMIRLSQPQPLTMYAGEENELQYIALGVGVVIPPWNFPLAILAGMTCAAIVTGNAVVLKPSSETPAIAYQFFSIMEEIGLPPGVLNFLPGSGASIGDFLIADARTRFIAFTGSKEIGLRINELAARSQKGQRWIKRVIAEMGGKNAIIVDDNADLDNAAAAIVTSAFGFQGQKCSACSRAILHEKIYDQLLGKIVERVKKVSRGQAEMKETELGPVASESAYKSILEYIAIGKKEGNLVSGGHATADGDGFFIEPTIIESVKPTARIAQEEIFGPVLALIKAKDWQEAWPLPIIPSSA